ncbi:endoribonuclease CG2145-like [Palaemon carinicauda]|uniref:endoribonuclease CG2145-like n=1 Tax=Palaemon carinicauda TaxID=392227 RepID=UPI0035B6880B
MRVYFLLIFLLKGTASQVIGGISPFGGIKIKFHLTHGGGRSCADPRLEFSDVAEMLLQLDFDRKLGAINRRKRCSSANSFTEALLPDENPHLLRKDTVRELKLLFNTDETNVQMNSNDAFLNAIVDTDVMRCLEDYLKSKEFITRNLKDVLHEYWFTEYWRGHKTSSGFQHVFQGEMKNGNVAGLHNWEGLKKKGYPFCFTKIAGLDKKGYVVEMRLKWRNQLKTVFVETSPELEMALYTLCFSFRTFGKRRDCFFYERMFYITTFKHVVGRKEVIEAAWPGVL